jgi:hypothetical protein
MPNVFFRPTRARCLPAATIGFQHADHGGAGVALAFQASASSLMYRHNASSGFFVRFFLSLFNQFLRYFPPEYGKAVFLFYLPPSPQDGLRYVLS